MSKLTNSVKKGTLWSVIVVIVIALGIVLSAVLGFNAHNSLKDTKTLILRYIPAYGITVTTLLSEVKRVA